MPDRLTGAEAEFFFRATFVPSILKCSYRKGEAVFSSDSLKTLAILKDYVTREATASKLQVSPFSKTDAAHLFRDCFAEPARVYGVAQIMISTDISDDSVVHFLRTVGPILDFQLDLQRSATPSLWSVARHAS